MCMHIYNMEKTQMMKTREHQRSQQQQLQQPHHSQHQQQMQLLLQRQAQQQQQQHQHAQQQQQQSGVGHLVNGTTNGMSENDSLAKQNGVGNALAAKMPDQKLNLPLQRDSLDDSVMKQRLGNNASPLLDPNHASILKSSPSPGQPSGQVLPATSVGMAPHAQGRNQQFPGSTPDVKPEINSIMNARAAGLEGSLIGVPGVHNQAGNNLTLKGMPLMGIDQFRSGVGHQAKSMMPGHQALHQLQMLTSQHQQQLILAQQSLTSPSTNDIESRKHRMLYSNQSLTMGKDGLPNPVDSVVPNITSPLQAGGPVLSRSDPEYLMKLKFAQLQQQKQSQGSGQSQQQQIQQLVLSGQQPQSSNQILLQDKIMGAGHITGDGSMSNSFHGNEQSSKNQNGRKRKHATSSSGPANSSGTPNTAGPSPSSAPSTPSTHTAGDVTMPALQHGATSSKPLVAFESESSGTLKSPPNQLWDDKKFASADMDHLMDDVEDNVESFLSHDDADIRDDVGRGMDASKGSFSFTEVNSVRASSNKVVCCHFSSDGKLLASGDHDKKVVLWYTDTLKPKYTLEEHTSLVTDVRFSPSMARLATSSFDKTVRVWDADNHSYSIRTFFGHSACVTSLDFHPTKEDIICSCDDNGEIRYWSINNGSCTRVSKGGTTQVRFQPRLGRYLAAASDNIVSVLDAEAQTCRHSLKGHTSTVHSICWDPSGELLASVSDDSVRVWSLRTGSSEGECLHELSCNGNKFHSCVFHPAYSSLLIIGCYQSLEVWNMAENAKMTVSGAHEGLIASLAVSMGTGEGLVASASHDRTVKLWK